MRACTPARVGAPMSPHRQVPSRREAHLAPDGRHLVQLRGAVRRRHGVRQPRPGRKRHQHEQLDGGGGQQQRGHEEEEEVDEEGGDVVVGGHHPAAGQQGQPAASHEPEP